MIKIITFCAIVALLNGANFLMPIKAMERENLPPIINLMREVGVQPTYPRPIPQKKESPRIYYYPLSYSSAEPQNSIGLSFKEFQSPQQHFSKKNPRPLLLEEKKKDEEGNSRQSPKKSGIFHFHLHKKEPEEWQDFSYSFVSPTVPAPQRPQAMKKRKSKSSDSGSPSKKKRDANQKEK